MTNFFLISNINIPKLIIFLILCPIFISLDISDGLKFDAYYFNVYNYPSIPISILVLGIISVLNFKIFFKNKSFLILSFFIILYIFLNILFGNTRAIVVGIGMLLFFISYIIFCNKKYKIEYKTLFYILFFVLVLKFFTDIYLFYTTTYAGKLTHNINPFSTIFFLIQKFVIYSFYDYFPYIYYISSVFSIYNIIKKQYIKSSLILLFISFMVVHNTQSRIFIYGIYLIPILIFFYYLFKSFGLRLYIYICIIVVFIITISLGVYDFNISDESLQTRNMHALGYFNDFSFINILLPFINEYRINTPSSSFHNEFLEIWIFFGLVLFYYLFLLRNVFLNVDRKFNLIAYLIIFILLIGMTIQLNLTNPYIGIISGMIFGILSKEERKNIV